MKLLSLVRHIYMEVDVITGTANKIGSIVKRDTMRIPSGSLGRGEFYIVTLCIPGRSYNFLKAMTFKIPLIIGTL